MSRACASGSALLEMPCALPPVGASATPRLVLCPARHHRRRGRRQRPCGDRRRRRSVRVPAVDLRAGGFRRLLRGVVGDAGAAHAADVGDQRDLLGDRGRRAARRRRPAGRQRCRAAAGRARSASSRWSLPRSTSSAASWSPSACWPCTRRKKIRSALPMNANLAALLYLVAGVLFILALRGLSSPDTSRRGNLFGMVGMAIAIADHARRPSAGRSRCLGLVVLGMAIGGGIGAVIARRVPMTAMPQLVAAFHSLVGMAAVLVAAGALYAPGAFGIGTVGAIHTPEPDRDVARRRHRRHHLHRLGHRLPQADGPHERRADHPAGAPCHQHRARRAAARPHRLASWRARAISPSGCSTLTSFAARRAPHHPDRRRRHAGRDLDAQLLFGLGGGRHRLHAGKFRADHHRRAGRLVRRDPVLHHVQGDEPQLHLGDPRRLRRRGGGSGGRRRAAAGQAGLGRGRRLHHEERQQGHHRAGLRHGGGAGPARAARDGRQAQGRRASR